MNRQDRITKDPRIMKPLAELLQKIQEALDPPQAPTDQSLSDPTQNPSSSETKNKH